MMKYDVIVVGGGLAGLTAAAYLSRAGRSVLLCEKEGVCGGLISSFTRDGFMYDGGIRSTENAGVLFPMLKQLGLEIEFVRSQVSVGIEDRVVRIQTKEDVAGYQDLLTEMYPESKSEIAEIITQVKKIMGYMDVQYGIDNPILRDSMNDPKYLLGTILPWITKYAFTAPKIARLQDPVEEYLRRFTQNQSLLDIICQHFFKQTPAFFALSYISLYLDYHYPLGGTGVIPEKLTGYIESHGGVIRTKTQITEVDLTNKTVTDSQGEVYSYQRLIWAADQKALYRNLKLEGVSERAQQAITARKDLIADKTGNDSILALFLALDLDKSYFASKSSEHFFYSPSRIGESAAGPIPYDGDRQTIEAWLKRFFELTTYEISCPSLRDASLTPPGKTGLMISVLFDYRLTKQILEMGWYDDFKTLCENSILDVLSASIYPGLKEAVLHKFPSTPLTMEKFAGTTDGAIVGWAFTNTPLPAESRIPKIYEAVKTPIPGVLQAGQWTYSPAGLPISILTGKLAADSAIKDLSKMR